MTASRVVAVTRGWLDSIVIGLGLCPFARRELESGRIRFAVTAACDADGVLGALEDELLRLAEDESIATTLLIHPDALRSFADYNQFLDDAEALIVGLELDGVFQVASFHPGYQYAGTQPGDAENCINRSPYPLLHLLREGDVSAAVDAYPDVDAIPARNIATMNALGAEGYAALLRACLES